MKRFLNWVRQKITRLQSDIPRLLARALIIVDELAIEGDLDARAIGLNDEAVPRTDRDLRRGRRRLQIVDRTAHLERIPFGA